MIYIVIGHSGQYSDRSEWFVCYRVDEAEAKRVAEICQNQANEYADWLKNTPGGWSEGYDRDRSAAGSRRRRGMLDPAFWGSRGGMMVHDLVYYTVLPVTDDPADGYNGKGIQDPCGTCEVCALEQEDTTRCDCCDLDSCWLCKPEIYPRPECGVLQAPVGKLRPVGTAWCDTCQTRHNLPSCDTQ